MASATQSKTLKSWKLSCPQCGESEAITLDLNDLTTCTCSSCDDTFTPEVAVKKIADQLRRWQAVCEWIALAGECLATPETD